MPRNMMITAVLLASAAVLVAGGARSVADDGYARPQLLIQPDRLAEMSAQDRPIVLDARAKDDFVQGHIPAAHWVDHAAWSKAFADGQDAATWSGRISGLGMNEQAQVVVYDDNRSKDAARIWWILRYWGVEQVSLLDGGWTGWRAGDHRVDSGGSSQPAEAVEFVATPAEERLVTKAELLASLGRAELQVVDTRSEQEHCGIEALGNKRSGAIPGAKHLEWSDLVDEETQRFKPAAELSRLFAEAGIRLDRPAATYCQSGGRASVMAFALELMGGDQVSNYYRSWSEWGNADDTPIVTPAPSID